MRVQRDHLVEALALFVQDQRVDPSPGELRRDCVNLHGQFATLIIPRKLDQLRVTVVRRSEVGV